MPDDLGQRDLTDRSPRILLTGATGYVGKQLLPRLISGGYRLRCLTRRVESLERIAAPEVEVVEGDAIDIGSLKSAISGCTAAYYLIHSMATTADFERHERKCAQNFAEAAREAGLERIIYLGGLGDSRGPLSPHLRSRQQVGSILYSTGIPVLEFRASVIIGSGSLSFEMIRALVERLPIMITPRWVSSVAQPIAIADVIQYLMRALSVPIRATHEVVEIGGKDVVSYGELMRIYGRLRKLKRLMIPVPVLTPKLSSLWLGLVTPLLAPVGRVLIESIRHSTVVENPTTSAHWAVNTRGAQEAMAEALADEDQHLVAIRWSDYFANRVIDGRSNRARVWSRIVDSRAIGVPVSPDGAFQPIRVIGGKTGWYYADWLWRLRGWIDRLLGGVGMNRGRQDPENIREGDTIDCWRVVRYEYRRLLRLEAEMRLPGRAWLDFEVSETDQGSVIRQTAVFDPRGLFGLLYWCFVYPAHAILFRGMLRSIARAATKVNERGDIAA